jgi:hypothetical protein
MIALHIGIELTMNMHVFELLSIIGWCMFFIEPDQSYEDYIGTARGSSTNNTTGNTQSIDATKTKKQNHETKTALHGQGIIQYSTFINIFLLTLTTIIIIDTFPLSELHDILEVGLTVPLSSALTITASPLQSSIVSGLTNVVTNVQTLLLYLCTIRKGVLFPNVMKYLYPIGLYQDVWDLYKEAPDINCIFTTNITTYSVIQNDYHQMYSFIYSTPDWGDASWYIKKRYQRPMSMDFIHVCRDCYVRYHTNRIINEVLSNNETSVSNLQLASATLMLQCEHPPSPPAIDDWFNWSGWFYADAKQDVYVQHDPFLLYSTNICNDLNAGLCQQYLSDGLCDSSKHYRANAHTGNSNNGATLTYDDEFIYNITQMCRQSCHFCPEYGYDTNKLRNGTRLAIFWPPPKWSSIEQVYVYDETSMYYDCTIVEVRDRPLKMYQLKYDNSEYDNEWFDPMTLRNLGYHFLPGIDEIETVLSSTRPEVFYGEKVVNSYNDDDDHSNYNDNDNERTYFPDEL